MRNGKGYVGGIGNVGDENVVVFGRVKEVDYVSCIGIGQGFLKGNKIFLFGSFTIDCTVWFK